MSWWLAALLGVLFLVSIDLQHRLWRWRQAKVPTPPDRVPALRPCFRRVGQDRHRCGSVYFARLTRVGATDATPTVYRCALCATAYRISDNGEMIPEDIGWADLPWPERET